MAAEWQEVSLADAYEIGSGLSKPRADFGFGFPFLSFKDVFECYFVPSELKQLVNSSDQERATCSIRRGDVFLTRTSETLDELGMSSVALADVPDATFNGFTKRLRPKKSAQIHPEYAGYYFRSTRFRKQVDALSNPSTRASLNNEMIGRLTIILPGLAEQRAIAAILKPLDDKIGLNRRMNETLEAMARALFKSWFVDFDPVRAKAEGREADLPHTIACLFPSTFEDSEIGEIPVHWEVKGLDQLARFLNGLALQKYPPEEDRSLPVIKIAQLRACHTKGADRASADLPSDYIVQDGDILFSWSGSLECVRWAGGPGALNQHLFKVTSTAYPSWLCYLAIHLHLDDFRHIAAGKATTMGHIQRHHLSAAKLAVPSMELFETMGKHLAPILERTWRVEVESHTLSDLRDALLPKLISGEIRVKDAECVVAKAV